jgi:NAD(P)-dependent dehydrogenase (short-subunit alcohol dehydrogenase family)
MVEQTMDALGRIDVLVNNAALFGPLEYQPIEDISVDLWDRVMAINVRGVFLCCQAVVPIMKHQNGGKIINIASGTLLSGVPNFLHYITSKGAVFALTRALSREVGPFGITVNTLAPGLTLSDAVRLHHPQEQIDRSRNLRALARDEVPEDLEGAIAFLASDDSNFMTGQMIVVNGGAQFW